MHINETDLNKIMDALMSRDETQCLIAQSLIVKAKDHRADPELIKRTRELWTSSYRGVFNFEDLEIDDDAGSSPSDDGSTWVQAWFWVPAQEADDNDDSEDEDAGQLCPVDRAARESDQAVTA